MRKKKTAEPIVKCQRITIDPGDKGNMGICLNIYGKLYFYHLKSYDTVDMYNWVIGYFGIAEEMVIEMGNIYYKGCACNTDLQWFRESLVTYAESKGIKVKYCNVGYVTPSQMKWSGSINRELTELGYREKLEKEWGQKLIEDEWNAGIMDWIATNKPELLTERMEEEKFERREGICNLCRKKQEYPSRKARLTNCYQNIKQNVK